MSLEEFRSLQAGTDRWFSDLLRGQRNQLQCRPGCVLCCHGLFDISIPEALILAEGIESLPGDAFTRAHDLGSPLQRELEKLAPELESPFFLSELSEDRIDGIVSSMSGARCPLLDQNDLCSVYPHRPLACRIEGAPMVDLLDGPFGDWCELNFVAGVPPDAMPLLRRDYSAMQAVEERVALGLSERIAGVRSTRVTVFIPSVLAAFDRFWKAWLR